MWGRVVACPERSGSFAQRMTRGVEGPLRFVQNGGSGARHSKIRYSVRRTTFGRTRLSPRKGPTHSQRTRMNGTPRAYLGHPPYSPTLGNVPSVPGFLVPGFLLVGATGRPGATGYRPRAVKVFSTAASSIRRALRSTRPAFFALGRDRRSSDRRALLARRATTRLRPVLLRQSPQSWWPL